MEVRKQEQTKYEISTWLRMLDYHQQENIHMKTRIAEVIKRNVTKDVLDRLENFQNLFLNKDTVITFLRNDIQKINNEYAEGDIYVDHISSLRKDMQKMELEFNLLRRTFNEYMQALS